MTRLPSRSRSTRQPGSITVVQSSCSMTAGPSKRRVGRQPLAAIDRRLAPAGARTTRCGARAPPRGASRAARSGRRACERDRAPHADHGGVEIHQHRRGSPCSSTRSAASRRRRTAGAVRRAARRAPGSGDREDVALPLELHVGAVHEVACARPRRAPARCVARPSAICSSQMRRTRSIVDAPATAVDGADEVVAQVGHRRSPSALVMPGRAGISTVGIASSRASATACSGPAPPNANSAKSRGSWPRASDHHADRARHAVVGDAHDRRRGRRVGVEAERLADLVFDRAARSRVHRHRIGRPPSRLCRVQPAEHEVGVGDGRLARRRGRSRSGPGAAPALSGPTRSMPASSTSAIEPPPAPIVCTSTIGTWIGMAYSSSSSVETCRHGRPGSGRRRSRCRPCRR